jgi:hypothetical protein
MIARVGRRVAVKRMLSAALGLVMVDELHAQTPGDETISFRWTLPEELSCGNLFIHMACRSHRF